MYILLFFVLALANAQVTKVELVYEQLDMILQAIGEGTGQPCATPQDVTDASQDVIDYVSTNVASKVDLSDGLTATVNYIDQNIASKQNLVDLGEGLIEFINEEIVAGLVGIAEFLNQFKADAEANWLVFATALQGLTSQLDQVYSWTLTTTNTLELMVLDLGTILDILNGISDDSDDYLLKECDPEYELQSASGAVGTCSWTYSESVGHALVILTGGTIGTEPKRTRVCTEGTPEGESCAYAYTYNSAGVELRLDQDCIGALYQAIANVVTESGCKVVLNAGVELGGTGVTVSLTDVNMYNKDATKLRELDAVVEAIGNDWFTAINWGNAEHFYVDTTACALDDAVANILINDGVITYPDICGGDFKLIEEFYETPNGEKQISTEKLYLSFIGVNKQGMLQEATYQMRVSSPRFDEGVAYPIPNIHRNYNGPGWSEDTVAIGYFHWAETDGERYRAISDSINTLQILQVEPIYTRYAFSRNPLLQKDYWNEDYTVHDRIEDVDGTAILYAADQTFGQLGHDIVCNYRPNKPLSSNIQGGLPLDFCSMLGQSHKGQNYAAAMFYDNEILEAFGGFVASQPKPDISDSLTNAFVQSQNIQTVVASKTQKARQWISAAFNVFDFFVDVDIFSYIPGPGRNDRW